MTDDTRPDALAAQDAEKLRVLATWFDDFDDWREATGKIAPGIAEYREVQSDLRRIADNLARLTPAPAAESGEPKYAAFAAFEDEDGSWCVVTQPGGDYVAWPEMTEADADRLVALLARAQGTDAAGLAVERLADAIIDYDGDRTDAHHMAKLVAHEYARLAAIRSEEEGDVQS